VQADDIAGVASLIGDPARARMLASLMSGRALTATELALEAGVAPSTASAHLAKLTATRVLAIESQGRHRYFRLFDAGVADMLENLASIAATHVSGRRTGPADPALREARVCYDHLAGERGVWLLDELRARNALAGRDGLAITPHGESLLARIGVDVTTLACSRRPLCRACLDWSERRHHLGGALGAAILGRVLSLGWARRAAQGRTVTFSSSGVRSMRQWVG
jgi:DNA-binding transcriptional ArsR family regulator